MRRKQVILLKNVYILWCKLCRSVISRVPNFIEWEEKWLQFFDWLISKQLVAVTKVILKNQVLINCAFRMLEKDLIAVWPVDHISSVFMTIHLKNRSQLRFWKVHQYCDVYLDRYRLLNIFSLPHIVYSAFLSKASLTCYYIVWKRWHNH